MSEREGSIRFCPPEGSHIASMASIAVQSSLPLPTSLRPLPCPTLRRIMMLIRTRVRPSSIHGMGLFAVDPVPRGTPIWRFQPGFDRELTPADFQSLPPVTQEHVRWFAFLDPQTHRFVLGGDHSCFMNHSPEPNTGAPPDANPPIATVALRDIAAGEEITCNYDSFDAESGRKLGR
jgi:SET domain-containing protein